ncbi:hypothetical protein BG004_003293 [Podila humilis]|nr:hypothetical protein BG004_003293 [Podila humilis]
MKRTGTPVPVSAGRGADGNLATPPASSVSSQPAPVVSSTSTGKRPYHRKQIPAFKDSRINTSKNQDSHSGLIVYNNHQHETDTDTLSNFCQSMLRVSTVHMLQSSGYDAVQAQPTSVLVDVLSQYMEYLAEAVKEFAEHSGRSQITAFDVLHGFMDVGIDVEELKDWLSENGGVPDKSAEGITSSSGVMANGTGPSNTVTGPGINPAKVLPSWKGVDPGRIIGETVWNGRKRNPQNMDTYEWRQVPDGFIMPETEGEQDIYAYPDEESMDEGEISVPTKHRNTQSTTARRSNWIPESRPKYVPEHLPPFPGTAMAEEEPQDADPLLSFASSPATPYSIPAGAAAGLNAAGEGAGSTQELHNISEELAQTSIDTTENAAKTNDQSGSSIARAGSPHKDTNPYAHVVPFQESTLPFSALYSSVHPKMSKSNQSQQNPHSKDIQKLFSDTMMTILDAPSYSSTMSAGVKKRSRLAHAIATPGEASDTLFSNPQRSGVIDKLLKQSAPPPIMNKFAQTGISLQEIPVTLEKVPNGDFVAKELTTASMSRSASSLIPSSRKGSFSNSPLSTVSYPLKDNNLTSTLLASSSSLASNTSGTSTKATSKGGRKLSAAGTEGSALSSTVGTPVPAYSGAISSTPSRSVDRNILSRLGSNFDPAELLAKHSSQSSTKNLAPAANGLTNGQPAATLKTEGSEAKAQLATTKSSGTKAPVPVPATGHLQKVAAVSATSSVSQQVSSTPVAPVSKPVPAPISFSELADSRAKSQSNSTTGPAASTPTSATAAPKIRFKFSALDAISTDNSSSSLSPTSSTKRDHERSSSVSSNYQHEHHRSSSTTSIGSLGKKNKRSDADRDEEDEVDMDEQIRHKKKKKKKSKNRDRSREDRDRDKDRDRDRDRDRDSDRGSSSSRKHHNHHRHDSHSSSKNGKHSKSSSGWAAPYSYAEVVPPAAEQEEVINCVCAHPTLDDGLFMVACDKCQVWFHGRCVHIYSEAMTPDPWHCPRCI